MKKFFAYLLLFSFLIVSLSACAHKDDPPTSSSSSNYRSDLSVRAYAGDGQVTIDWQYDGYAETYNIYYLKDTGSTPTTTQMQQNGTKISGLKSAPYIVGIHAGEVLTNGTKYWFSMSGNNTGGESYLTKPDFLYSTPVSPPPPAAPGDVRANAGDSKVTVTWTPVSANPAVTSYNVYCFWQTSLTDLGEAKSTITGQASNHQVIDSSSITWIYNTDTADPGIVNGRPYTCWVTAVNDNGTADTSDDLESSPSFDYVATPSATPPPFAPVLTTATTGSSSSQQVILAWNAPVSSTGTVTYTVYYGTAKGVTNNTGVQADVGDATAVSVNNLTSGVKYYFVVTATDDNGQSAISNEESAVAY